MKKFLGVICILYSIMIAYVWKFDLLKNFLAPQMQMYIKVSSVVLFIMGLVIILSEESHYKFKISDLILVLPVVMLILASDGKLTTSFANNRTINTHATKKVVTKKIKEEEEKPFNKDDYDINDVYFKIEDDNYYDLSDYITYVTKPEKFEDKIIKVRGFTQDMSEFLSKKYFALGKYGVNCCTADAEFSGFVVKYDDYKVKDNTWYEVTGVLQKTKDLYGNNIMAIRILKLDEIDSSNEEQYVYPCYAYGNGMCTQITKYNLEN